MDSMKIESRFLTGLISKIICQVIKKKLGMNVSVKVNNIQVNSDDSGQIHFNLGLGGSIPYNDLERLIFASPDKK